ncbi:hypothetical protein [Kineococcus xinjiangensis]|uniref:hypothetical protein n=1 Tax=Kineococcus xinjiangensis TaxID=512762 RepID=UPI000CEC3B7C|nr:hypothetical protein [Kineococcus xinjiangensis]
MGTAYLTEHGAGVLVATHRLGTGSTAVDLCDWLTAADPGSEAPGGTCTQTGVPGGVLATVDAPADGGTGAAFAASRHIVRVTSHVMDTPTAERVADRRPVDVTVLGDLAQDPRLRW